MTKAGGEYARTINEPHCPKERPRCYVRSLTLQDAFQPISDLISCAGVTRRWGLLSHAQNAVRWLALSRKLVEVLQRHRLFMQLSCIDWNSIFSPSKPGMAMALPAPPLPLALNCL